MSSDRVDLDHKVRTARQRRRQTPAIAGDERTVQLAVRLPAELRQRVHRAAAAAGSESTQQWLEGVIGAAVGDALDPQRRVATRLREALLAGLAEQVDRGGYRDVVAALAREDPDLA